MFQRVLCDLPITAREYCKSKFRFLFSRKGELHRARVEPGSSGDCLKTHIHTVRKAIPGIYEVSRLRGLRGFRGSQFDNDEVLYLLATRSADPKRATVQCSTGT
jgi:hypothetical protein